FRSTRRTTSPVPVLAGQRSPDRRAISQALPRPGDNACEIARRSGLRCLVRTGTWNVIRRLDVPAMLTLMTPTGERHYATVTALGADTVTLDLAPRPVTLLLNDVERFWDGAF